MNPIALVFIVIVLISVGVYFGTKKDDKKKPAASGGAGGAGGAADKRRDEKTPADDFSGGSMIHLDRHHVKCGDDGLTGFNLTKPDEGKIQYKYKCLDGIDSAPGALKNTGANDWGGNNAIYLDRHNVDCDKAPVNEFKLTRPTAGQIAYDYKCSSKKAAGACRDVDVKGTVKGKAGKTDSMVNVDVACNKDEVLTKFRFYRADHDTPNETAGYKYTCCKM